MSPAHAPGVRYALGYKSAISSARQEAIPANLGQLDKSAGVCGHVRLRSLVLKA